MQAPFRMASPAGERDHRNRKGGIHRDVNRCRKGVLEPGNRHRRITEVCFLVELLPLFVIHEHTKIVNTQSGDKSGGSEDILSSADREGRQAIQGTSRKPVVDGGRYGNGEIDCSRGRECFLAEP
jgi:hypothetical protein